MNQSTATLHPNATILVVEDEEMTVRLLKRMLQRAGYHNIHTTMDAAVALTLHHELCPDLMILDLHMPSCEGFMVLEQLGAQASEHAYMPVLMLTGDTSTEAKHQAFVLGVTDFLTKPLDYLEVRYRASNLLRTRFLYLEIQHRNRLLDELGSMSGPLLGDSRPTLLPNPSVERKARVATVRQNLAGEVADHLARRLGLDDEEAERVGWVAHLYSVAGAGAVHAGGYPLDRRAMRETDRLKSHIREEAKLIFPTPPAELLALAEEVVLARDERWDGSGYPEGLSGDQIPLAGRIIAVAEHYAELASSALHHPAGRPAAGLLEIVVRGGRRFDPQVVRALVELDSHGALNSGE